MDFKKMALVDPKVLQAFQSPTQDPLKKILSELDKEMSRVLESDMSDREKVFLYNQILHKYNEFRTQNDKPLTVQLKPPPETHLSSAVEDQVIQFMPMAHKTRAIDLMNRIKRSEDLSWNDKGEFVYQGKPIENTHMVDLVGDVMRARKNVKPFGWETFANALSKLNIPEEMVGNKERWNYMKSNQEVFTTPPVASRLARGRGLSLTISPSARPRPGIDRASPRNITWDDSY